MGRGNDVRSKEIHLTPVCWGSVPAKSMAGWFVKSAVILERHLISPAFSKNIRALAEAKQQSEVNKTTWCRQALQCLGEVLSQQLGTCRRGRHRRQGCPLLVFLSPSGGREQPISAGGQSARCIWRTKSPRPAGETAIAWLPQAFLHYK